MITNWSDFDNWREQSVIFHKQSSEYSYLNALTYFEYARKYFNKNGFPQQTEKYKNGKLKPWSAKQNKSQKEDINEFIKNIQKRRSRK